MQTTLPKKPVAEAVHCYHCGDECVSQPIVAHEKPFCCEGCKAVYELLEENGLCNYYDLDKNPGISLKQPAAREAYDFLAEEAIVKRLIDFTDGKTTRITFYIPSIHCSSCLWLLENLPKLMPAVIGSRVNFVKKELTLSYQQQVVTLRQVVEMLASLGYAPLITLEDDTPKERKASPHRKLYMQLGVAAFCFGNMMLLSFPEYLGFQGDEEHLKEFIGYLNFLLSLPVVFFSAQGYFAGAYNGLRKKFVSIDVPISLGIIALFLRSSYEVFSGTGAGYFDSLGGLLFFLLIGRWFQNKSYDHLSFERKYTSYFPLAVLKWDNGRTRSMPVADIRKGDVLVIRNRELIPADGLLLETKASIDYSFVTGESAPVARRQNDLLYAGGRQVGESIKILVEKEVSQSYLTQLWNDGSFQKEKEDEHALTINVIAKYFTLVVMVLATAAFVFWWGQSAAIAINAFTAVLIVACPCALALATPFTLGNTMAILGKSGLYLKNTHIIEKMASAGRLVFDKTGTLTQAKGHEGRLDTTLEAPVLDAVYSITSHSTHPLSRKLHDYLGKGGGKQLKVEGYVETEGRGIEAMVNGQTYRIGAPTFCFYAEKEVAEEGSEVFIAQNGRTLGRFMVSSQMRNGLDQVVSSLATSYSMSLLSGDRPADRAMMEAIFPVGSPMHFQQRPEDKLRYVAERQAAGETVIMLGDGLNDAGALQRADVGIAVSEDVANFSPASDGILDARSFSMLPAFLKLSRKARKIILICFGVSFAYNIVGLSFAITGMLTPLLAAVLMPVSSITIVALSTLLVRVAASQLKLT